MRDRRLRIGLAVAGAVTLVALIATLVVVATRGDSTPTELDFGDTADGPGTYWVRDEGTWGNLEPAPIVFSVPEGARISFEDIEMGQCIYEQVVDGVLQVGGYNCHSIILEDVNTGSVLCLDAVTGEEGCRHIETPDAVAAGVHALFDFIANSARCDISVGPGGECPGPQVP